MTEISLPSVPGDPATKDAPEAELAALTAPLEHITTTRVAVIQLAAAVVMTADGAGLALAARPGLGGPLAAAGCALLLAARLAVGVPALRRHLGHPAGRPAHWTAAAAVHEQSLPARLPAATRAAAARYLPLMPRPGQGRAWLYCPPCPGNGTHTALCCNAMAWEPGGEVMVIVGQHIADDPAVAAVALAHEAGHHAGWTRRAFAILHAARSGGGWGWAAAGLIGTRWGWPGVVLAAVIFQGASLLAQWVIEAVCDRHAARTEGTVSVLHACAFMTAADAAQRAADRARHHSRAGHALATAIIWAAGPPHPPARLRAALTRLARHQGSPQSPGRDHA